MELRCDESCMVMSDILLAVWLICEVEYAGKAVENSGTTLAICCKVISEAFLKLPHVGCRLKKRVVGTGNEGQKKNVRFS